MTRFGKIALGALLAGGLAMGAMPPAANARVVVGVGIGAPGPWAGHSCRWFWARGLRAPPGCYGGWVGPAPVGLSFVARPGWNRVWWHNRWAWRRPVAWRRPIGWRRPGWRRGW